jgi:hypothetical protein
VRKVRTYEFGAGTISVGIRNADGTEGPMKVVGMTSSVTITVGPRLWLVKGGAEKMAAKKA